jgi:hypothetical protein
LTTPDRSRPAPTGTSTETGDKPCRLRGWRGSPRLIALDDGAQVLRPALPLQTVDREPPSFFVSEPRWNIALARFVDAVVFGVLYTRRMRADARPGADAED